MSFALRAHGFRRAVLIQLVLAALGVSVGGMTLPFPSLGGTGTAGLPVPVLTALAGSIVLAGPSAAAWPAARTNGVRSASATLIAVLGLTIGPTALLCGAVALLLPGAAAADHLGVLAWMLALQLAVGTWISARHQAMGPAVYVLLCALLGRSGSVVQPWAWPLADVPSEWALVFGLTALALALACLARFGLHLASTP